MEHRRRSAEHDGERPAARASLGGRHRDRGHRSAERSTSHHLSLRRYDPAAAPRRRVTRRGGRALVCRSPPRAQLELPSFDRVGSVRVGSRVERDVVSRVPRRHQLAVRARRLAALLPQSARAPEAARSYERCDAHQAAPTLLAAIESLRPARSTRSTRSRRSHQPPTTPRADSRLLDPCWRSVHRFPPESAREPSTSQAAPSGKASRSPRLGGAQAGRADAEMHQRARREAQRQARPPLARARAAFRRSAGSSFLAFLPEQIIMHNYR